MRVAQLLAELAVRDHDAACEWYARLFERPADARPMDGLAEWHLAAAGGLQVFRDAERAGAGLLTLVVDGLEAELARLAAQGIEPVTRGEATTLAVGFATIADPDGNAITLVDAPGS